MQTTKVDELQIAIDAASSSIKPGGRLVGTVSWNLSSRPETIELALFWRTEGKGTQDVGVDQVQPVAQPAAAGSHDFALELPSAPYSFSSRFLSLVWALEATVTPGDFTRREEFVLSPTGQEIVLMEPL